MQSRKVDPPLLLVLLLACAQAAVPSQDTCVAFLHASVVPMDQERVLEDQVVVVCGGRIVEMGPSATVAVPRDAHRIDASGHYLIPGLADMHVHLQGARTVVEPVLRLHLVNGVTTVFNLDGRPSLLELRREIEAGELTAPRIFSAGPTLRGPPSTREEGRQAVRQQKELGYDAVKVYSFLPREAYLGVVEEARRLGMPVVGHAVRAAGGIQAALDNGQDIVHMEEFIYGYFRQGIDPSSFPEDPAATREILQGYLDASRIGELARKTRTSGIYVTPNLVAYHGILLQVQDLEGRLARPEVGYLPRSFLVFWGPKNNRYTTRPNLPRFEASLAISFPFLQKLTAAFQEAGIPLLLGTDAPIPTVVPGFAAHDELEELVTAGLTTYQALLTATRRPAQHLNRLKVAGTVEVGKEADLVLLKGNPLEDMAHSRDIAGVMVRGRWLPRQELDRWLAELHTTK